VFVFCSVFLHKCLFGIFQCLCVELVCPTSVLHLSGFLLIFCNVKYCARVSSFLVYLLACVCSSEVCLSIYLSTSLSISLFISLSVRLIFRLNAFDLYVCLFHLFLPHSLKWIIRNSSKDFSWALLVFVGFVFFFSFFLHLFPFQIFPTQNQN
jgi:hypothetical protein